MKLCWHLVRHDLRYLKWLTLALAGAVLLKCAVGWVAVATWIESSRANELPDFRLASAAALTLEALVTVFVVAALIQKDEATSANAFWRTRPISRGQLLRSKLTSALLVLGVVPPLATIPWWIWNHLTPELLARTLVDTWLWQFGLAIVAAPVATLTRTRGGFIAALIALVVAVFAGLLIASHLSPRNFVGPRHAFELSLTTVVFALMVTGAVAATLHHLLGGKFPITISIIGCTVVAACWAMAQWRFAWPFAEPASPSTLTVQAGWSSDTPRLQAWVDLSFAHVPADTELLLSNPNFRDERKGAAPRIDSPQIYAWLRRDSTATSGSFASYRLDGGLLPKDPPSGPIQGKYSLLATQVKAEPYALIQTEDRMNPASWEISAADTLPRPVLKRRTFAGQGWSVDLPGGSTTFFRLASPGDPAPSGLRVQTRVVERVVTPLRWSVAQWGELHRSSSSDRRTLYYDARLLDRPAATPDISPPPTDNRGIRVAGVVCRRREQSWTWDETPAPANFPPVAMTVTPLRVQRRDWLSAPLTLPAP